MGKHRVLVILLVAVICLCSFLIPKAFSQPSSGVRVVSYSWYVSSSTGDFIAVGEVQNIGNTVLQSVTLNGTVYSTTDTLLASSSAIAYGSYLLPQQKAPFYMDFGSPGTELSSVGSVDFTVFSAPTSTYEEYPSLTLSPAPGTVLNGIYVVMGFVYNFGDQTADDIRVVGTYYNSTGGVVAVGFDILNESLPPTNATSFTLTEFDATPSLVAQISNSSLIVQTSTLVLENNSLPSSTPTIKPGTGGFFPMIYLYAIAIGIVAVVVMIIVALLIFRRRNVASEAPLPPLPPPPPR